MNRTRVKFCGITRVDDALSAVALGVDAIGIVLTARSRRRVGLEQARAIRRAVPPFVTVVALFMDDEPAFVREALGVVAPDLAQFHGSETAADCVRYGIRYLKAVAMGGDGDVAATVSAHAGAAGILFDGNVAGAPGGGGHAFDWTRLDGVAAPRVILAGGLDATNVGAAIARVRPFAVDVASGIESAPGIKDESKMRNFLASVRVADGS